MALTTRSSRSMRAAAYAPSSRRRTLLDADTAARLDWVLIGAVVSIALLGLVMIYSASSVADYVHFGDSAYHLKRQAGWVLVGLLALVIFARLDYRRLRQGAWWLLVASDVGLLLVLTHGVGKWGAQR